MKIRAAIFLGLFFLAACGTDGARTPVDADKIPLRLDAARFADLPGWADDTQSQTMAALQKSCGRILKRKGDDAFGPSDFGTFGDWQPACRAALMVGDVDDDAARAFFERWFTPHRASAQGDVNGLFTGYYEAMLRGARTRNGPYQTPLYGMPDDLVMVELGDFRENLKGERIAGRVEGNRLRPYEDRKAIETSGIPEGRAPVLAWVDDPVSAFFLHIQGSGVIALDDGGMMRVGYAGQNGHVYYAVGRDLVKRGVLAKEEVSMQSIRAWMEDNPQEASSLMQLNPSYIFFQEIKGDGPLGGEGVALTAERSLAVDRAKIPYGVPVWLASAPPAPGEAPLRRLMVAQDTGGAIRGAVRGDVFWGRGPRAEHLAGLMKSQGYYWLLLPKKEQ